MLFCFFMKSAGFYGAKKLKLFKTIGLVFILSILNNYFTRKTLIMKSIPLYLAMMALPLLFSCSQTGNKGSELKDSLAMDDTTGSKQCYIAVDGKDTASLSIKTMNSGKVSGKLVINYAEKGKNDGAIEGTFKGDTLFVDYTFKIGTANKTIYKNPLAFLNQDGKLILGVGQIETTMGRSYFVKGKPISFDKGRFTFAAADCKE